MRSPTGTRSRRSSSLADSGIEITPDKITDKPEKAKIDLIVAVSVADWTVANVTPEI